MHYGLLLILWNRGQCANRTIKPGVHLIITIATITGKSVSDHSNQMDKSLLTIPMIVTIVMIVIAGIGSGSIPVIASVIVMIVNGHNDHMDTGQ